jgi:hypothetical protein
MNGENGLLEHREKDIYGNGHIRESEYREKDI